MPFNIFYSLKNELAESEDEIYPFETREIQTKPTLVDGERWTKCVGTIDGIELQLGIVKIAIQAIHIHYLSGNPKLADYRELCCQVFSLRKEYHALFLKQEWSPEEWFDPETIKMKHAYDNILRFYAAIFEIVSNDTIKCKIPKFDKLYEFIAEHKRGLEQFREVKAIV